MQEVGLEPTRYFYRQILSLLRLPITPLLLVLCLSHFSADTSFHGLLRRIPEGFMLEEGLEPSRSYEQGILSPRCLPFQHSSPVWSSFLSLKKANRKSLRVLPISSRCNHIKLEVLVPACPTFRRCALIVSGSGSYYSLKPPDHSVRYEPQFSLYGSSRMFPNFPKSTYLPWVRMSCQGKQHSVLGGGMDPMGFEPTTPCLQSRCAPIALRARIVTS